MSKIEIPLSEYQAMRTKIEKLNSALNTVSTEAARYKEIIESARTKVSDITDDTFLGRLFRWKSIKASLGDLFKGYYEGEENGHVGNK